MLEFEYMKNNGKSDLILLEMLAYLKIRGLSHAITFEAMNECIKKLRYIGLVPDIQLCLVLLAEMNFMENQPEKSAEFLKEAAELYREYNISASFFVLSLKSVHLLKNIDRQIYNEVIKRNSSNEIQTQTIILSDREKEIMQLVALGKSNEEISKTLFIGIGTIKWHLNHIFSKLEVKNRIQAAQKAKSLGIIS